MRRPLIIGLLLLSFTLFAERPNVLFIAVDDLKPMLGCYGDSDAHTPAIDALAERGTTYLNAHCQQAVCSPSRASLLTGKRPDSIRIWDLQTKIRKTNPGIVTLPEFFKINGYETTGVGKIYDPRATDGRGTQDANSWSIPYTPTWNMAYNETHGKPITHYHGQDVKEAVSALGKDAPYAKVNRLLETKGLLKAVESIDIPDDAYDDGAIANHALKQLDRLQSGDKPFFLAVGFKKPHLPFVAPKKYWDLYDRSAIRLEPFQELAANSPELAYHDGNELRGYVPVPAEGKLSDDLQRELIHGYRACVSYVDAQIAKLMNALKERQLDRKTIVVLWGDHGWHLGDHGLWAKHSNFEQATRSPLIVVAPGLTKGQRSTQPVEFLDIFPTLTDLCGLETPAALEGVSLRASLLDASAPVKAYAVSQFPRGQYMGYAIRDSRYRYVAWLPHDGTVPGNLNGMNGEELYDYQQDPREEISVVDTPEYAAISRKMRRELKRFLRRQKAGEK